MGFLCASQVSHLRQPKLHWTSFDLLPVWEARIVSGTMSHFEVDVGNSDRWVSQGYQLARKHGFPQRWAENRERIREVSPPTWKKCEDGALEHWMLDNYSVPPCC